jgi:hypothetical protein
MWTTKERTHSNTEEIIYESRLDEFLKCHRNVTKKTNLLQVDNLSTNKSMAIFEAPRRNMNTQCVKISLLSNVKKSQKHYNSIDNNCTTWPKCSTWCRRKTYQVANKDLFSHCLHFIILQLM